MRRLLSILLVLLSLPLSANGRQNIISFGEYDQNGNLTKDLNKNISSIQYNSLNLPTSITYSDGRSAAYIYDAGGRKLRTSYQVSAQATPVPTDYCGNMIYENNVLNKILVDGGYITFSGTTPVYHCYLKDHLGNNREVVSESGTLEQVTNYYPFGSPFCERTTAGANTNATLQRFKYNGKELDLMHGLKWYDYGARMYDPLLLTWNAIDPLAEKYYSICPYAYCANNPVNAFDEEGRLTIFINGFKPVPWESGEDYWGKRADIFMKTFNESKKESQYYDGSIGSYASLFPDANAKPNPWYFSSLNADARFCAGMKQGNLDAKMLLDKLERDENGNIIEILRIATHSMGGAYGKGFATAIMNYYKNNKDFYKGFKIIEYDFAPYNAEQQVAVDGVTTWQIHDVNDVIANCTPILGSYYLPVFSGNNGISSHSIDNNAFWNMLLYLAPGNYHVVDGNIVPE